MLRPLVLINNDLCEVALVVEPPNSKCNAVLRREKHMDVLDSVAAQINRCIKKLLTKRTLFFLGSMAVRRALVQRQLHKVYVPNHTLYIPCDDLVRN